MAILGKLAGGACGFFLGGPWGAVVGAASGHFLDRHIDIRRRLAGEARTEARDARRRDAAFTIAVVALSAKMARAEGDATPKEIQAFRRVLDIPPEELEAVIRAFETARRDSGGFEPYARRARKLFAGDPEVLERLLDGLFRIAAADHDITADEIRFLHGVADTLGFDEAAFQRIRDEHVRLASRDPYKVLGIPAHAGDSEIRTAWRRLIREHHPDALMAQGLPADFVTVASGKMAAINAAYDEIRRQRGR